MARRDLLPSTLYHAKKHPHGDCRCQRLAKHNVIRQVMELFVRSKIKVHSLTGRITYRLVYDSFRAVRANRGAAGIDKVSIKMFEANLLDNLWSVLRDLKDGSFEPKPLRRHFIDKGQGKLRPLGIPAVRDRVAQETLRRLLTPIFEPMFHDASYGFRPGRNCHMALQR